jgi:hypothetical protein
LKRFSIRQTNKGKNMKKTFTVIALLTVMIFNEMLIIKPANALVHVDGYIKGNGTYVAPHYRTNPDGNPYNNFGSWR